MTDAPSTGWRGTYEWCHVDPDEQCRERLDKQTPDAPERASGRASRRGERPKPSDSSKEPTPTTTRTTETAETTGESAPNPNIRESVVGGMGDDPMIELPAVEAHPNEHPRFDVGVTIDTEHRQGRLDVTLSLSEADCEAIYEQSAGGHDYADDAREAVLRALGFDGVYESG